MADNRSVPPASTLEVLETVPESVLRSVEPVFGPAGHPGGARPGGAAAVLRRPRGVAASQRPAGGADRGRQLRGVDAQPQRRRRLHRAGLRGGAAGPPQAHRAAAVGGDGAGHHGVLRGSRAAAGPLRGAVDRADGRHPAVQPRSGVRGCDRLRRPGRGTGRLGHPDGGQHRRRRGARRHRTRTAVPGRGAELGRHRARHGHRGHSATRPHRPGQR